MRRIAAAAVSLLLAHGAAAQVPAPADWRKESFTFPLQFAPSIPYEGVEHVRFAPSWTDFDGERGFTYVFLWDIRRRALEPQEIERGLRVYFDGLMEAVTKARKLADPGTVTRVSLHPITTPKAWAAGYAGRLWTWNGFSKGEDLALHLEVAMRDCGAERTQAFFAFSRAPREHAAWRELREVREATPCAGDGG